MQSTIQLPQKAQLQTNGTVQTPAFVSFSAEVNPNTSETLIATMSNIVNQGIKTVHLLISTPGGSVMNGLNVYNVLRGMPIQLTTHNVGNVDSIGNAIFLAGEKRYACPHSTFMFHGVSFQSPGPVSANEKQLLEVLDNVRSDQKKIGSVIKDRTRIGEEAVHSLFLEAQTKDANFALASGIIHEIRDVQIPAGCPVIPLVFQR